MSYEPTNWKDGDLVTSAKLNKIEQGIAENNGSSILKVGIVIEENSMKLDKTFKEIRDAMKNGIPAYITHYTEEQGVPEVVMMLPITAVYEPYEGDPGMLIGLGEEGDYFRLYAQTENDYPSENSPDSDDEESDVPGQDSGAVPPTPISPGGPYPQY